MAEDTTKPKDDVTLYVYDGEEVVMTGRTARKVVSQATTQKQAAPRRRPVSPTPQQQQVAPEVILYEVKSADDTFSTKRWVTLNSLYIIDELSVTPSEPISH